MKRFAKIILCVLAGLVGLFVLGLLGINLYLQSADVQQRIRLATERAIGMPVTVQRTLYLPWSGLTLSGLSLPDPTLPQENLVHAPTFAVKFEFLPLLGRKFVISEVNLDSPHLALRQTQDRRWVLLPPPRPAATPVPAPPAGTEPSVDRPAAPPAYAVELRRFRIENGSADIIDRNGSVLVRIEGVQLTGSLDAQRRIEGDLWIDSISLLDQFFPNRLRAHFVQANDRLIISDLKAALAGGRIRADAEIAAPRKAAPVFQVRGEIEEVSVPELLAEATGDDADAAGTLQGRFELHGNPLLSSTLVGKGDFSLDSAQLRPLDFIQQIGALLSIDELQLLKLREATLKARVQDEKVLLDDFTLRTENLAILGTGPIRFNGKLKLQCRLLLNDKLQRQLDAIVGDTLEPSEDANFRQVSFSVTGRVDRPQTDLVERITGYKVPNIGGLLKGLFRMPAPASRPQDDDAGSAAPNSTPASN